MLSPCVEKRECSSTAGGNVNWYSHYRRWHGHSLKKKKIGIKPPYDPAVPLLGIYHEGTKIENDACISLFIAALFSITRTWKQLRCPLTDKWIKKYGTYTQWNITHPYKGCLWVSSNEADEPRTYYTEWSESERER